MRFRYLRSELRQYKDQIHRIGARNRHGLDFVKGVGLVRIFGGTLQDRLQPGCILQLLVCDRILMSLETGYSVVCPQLGAHFGEDCQQLVKVMLRLTRATLQFRVVFMRPTLTSKQTIAILSAAVRSDRSFSLRILLVLLLLAIASM